MPAGYSDTPLLKKLGIRENMKVLLIHAPANYFQLLEKDISRQICRQRELPDLIHFFSVSTKDFEKEMKKLLKVTQKNPAAIIWVSWYKKASGLATNLSEDTIRNYALQNGLVDIKVCAVNNEWSGLKLVVPLHKR